MAFTTLVAASHKKTVYRNCKLHLSIHMGNVCASRDYSNPLRTDATMTKATLPSSSNETEKDRRRRYLCHAGKFI